MRMVGVIVIGIVAPPGFIAWIDEPIDEVIVIAETLETGQSRTAVGFGCNLYCTLSFGTSIVRHSVVPVSEYRDKSPSPGPSNTVKLTISNKLLRPLKKFMKQHLKEISSSDDSENEKLEKSNSSSEDETNETSQSNDENDVSFTNVINTLKLIKKSDMVPRKPAINSRAQVVTKDLFKKSNAECKTASNILKKKIMRLGIAKYAKSCGYALMCYV
ncbi:hypothetical protein FQR65_LT11460 [Abscondita terminalis]|nr:hypothetical protein FQR65_LT11460 [Abscondita terminalis]